MKYLKSSACNILRKCFIIYLAKLSRQRHPLYQLLLVMHPTTICGFSHYHQTPHCCLLSAPVSTRLSANPLFFNTVPYDLALPYSSCPETSWVENEKKSASPFPAHSFTYPALIVQRPVDRLLIVLDVLHNRCHCCERRKVFRPRLAKVDPAAVRTTNRKTTFSAAHTHLHTRRRIVVRFLSLAVR